MSTTRHPAERAESARDRPRSAVESLEMGMIRVSSEAPGYGYTVHGASVIRSKQRDSRVYENFDVP